MSDNNFVKLAKINVGDHIEKKNGLAYLSWPFAVAELMKADPLANWEFHEPTNFGESLMVSCTVTAFGKPVTMHLPVMDHRNQAVKNPDAVVVNKNMMRCLVKAIACHGIGLYIYAGEDLPEGEEKPVAPAKPAAQPFDLDKALAFIAKASTLEAAKERGREAYKHATNSEEKARIQNAVESFNVKEAA